MSATSERLIDEATDDASVLQRVAQCLEEEAGYHKTANKAKNAFAEAKKRTQAAVQFASEHYARTRNIEMNFTVPREDPD
jgi:hypothetical protein